MSTVQLSSPQKAVWNVTNLFGAHFREFVQRPSDGRTAICCNCRLLRFGHSNTRNGRSVSPLRFWLNEIHPSLCRCERILSECPSSNVKRIIYYSHKFPKHFLFTAHVRIAQITCTTHFQSRRPYGKEMESISFVNNVLVLAQPKVSVELVSIKAKEMLERPEKVDDATIPFRNNDHNIVG